MLVIADSAEKIGRLWLFQHFQAVVPHRYGGGVQQVGVLQHSFRLGPEAQRVVGFVHDLLRAKHLAFSVPDQLTRAHAAYAAGKGDFADYLVREHARGAGCDEVATFDKVLLRERGFTAPK